MTSRRSGLALVATGASVCAAVLGLGVRPVETHPRITTTLLWARDMAPILQRRCFTCHSPNNVSMSLVTYAEARPWAAAIREEVLLRHMPPWSAVAGYGRFQNDPTLTQGEWDLLVAWVDGGAPSGQTLQEAEVAPVYVPPDATWQLGEPDLTAPLPKAHAVAANAPEHVQRVEVPTGFDTDRRLHGIGFKPGDRRVVRYAAIYESGTGRWLFTWTPWFGTMHLPEGVAYTLKAGATLTVEIGYRGTEDATTDTSEVGFYLDKAPAGPAASTRVIDVAPAQVAPGAPPVRQRAELVWDEAAALQAVYPEVSPGTASLELTAHLPDGSLRPLLWLRELRTDWPTPLVFVDPVPLPRGTRMVLTTYVANSGEAAITSRPRVHLLRVPSGATTY